MSEKIFLQNEELFQKIRIISNRFRFRIIELSQKNQPSISEISSILKLSYTKCADYIQMLNKQGLVSKIKIGKEIKIKSNVKLYNNKITFQD